MKLFFVALFAVAGFETISGNENDELFKLFTEKLPSDASFVTVGNECSINRLVLFYNKDMWQK
jgi:hypothetical protein